MNPFNFDKLAVDAEFCGREAELAKLNNIVLARNNLVIYGERRYGKSSLIQKAFRDFPNTVLPIYADIYRCVDEMDVALTLYHAVIEALPFSLEQRMRQIPSLFSRLTISMTPSRSGDSISFKPALEGKEFSDLVRDTFDAIEIVCRQKGLTHAVIAIDEFQQISKMKNAKIDAVLREISQANQHVCFIFSGSKKNMLRHILSSKDAPWYGMTTPLTLKGIEEEAFYNFCRGRLAANLPNDVFSALYARAHGQTRLILQICARWHGEGLSEITIDDMNDSLQSVIDDYDDEYRHLFMNLPAMQRKAVMAIGLSGGQNVFQKSILEECRISKQSLYKALLALEESEEIVRDGEGAYRFYELMMSLWVESKLIAA